MSTVLASIPIARLTPRSATTFAVVTAVTVKNAGTGLTPNGNTIVAAANVNRTSLLIRNTDAATDVRYSYTDQAGLGTGNIGFPLKAFEALTFDINRDVYMAGVGADVVVEVDEGSG
jgi:hypothetical protein